MSAVHFSKFNIGLGEGRGRGRGEGAGGRGQGYPRWESINADTKYGRSSSILRSHESKILLLASLGDWKPTGTRMPPHPPPPPRNPPCDLNSACLVKDGRNFHSGGAVSSVSWLKLKNRYVRLNVSWNASSTDVGPAPTSSATLMAASR